jgi:hypothetical protein
MKIYSPQKGGFLKDAAAEGISLVFPDTSPRGAGVDGEDDDWTFGTGTLTDLSYSRLVILYRCWILHRRDFTQILAVLQHVHLRVF